MGMIFKIQVIEEKIDIILEDLISLGYIPIKTKMTGKNLYTYTTENVEKNKNKFAIFFRK